MAASTASSPGARTESALCVCSRLSTGRSRLPLVLTELVTRLRHGASHAAIRRRHPATDGGQDLASQRQSPTGSPDG